MIRIMKAGFGFTWKSMESKLARSTIKENGGYKEPNTLKSWYNLVELHKSEGQLYAAKEL